MKLEELLAKLGETIGVDTTLSDEGTAGIVFDGDEVDFELAGPRLYIIADLGAAEGKNDMFGEILEANNLSSRTGYGTIGLDSARGVFTLSRIFEGEMEYPAFEDAVETFVNTVRHWKDRLENGTAATATASGSFGALMGAFSV